MDLKKLQIGDTILYLFPKSNPLSSVLGIFIGYTGTGSIEIEWFDKDKRYWYTIIDQENLKNIKQIFKSKSEYVPKRIFQRFDIHDEEHIKEPTMNIVKRLLIKKQRLHKDSRRTEIKHIAEKETTLIGVESKLKKSKRN